MKKNTQHPSSSLYALPSIPKTTQRDVKDFTYTHFRRIADKAPFTVIEWSEMLHISERTLHRYAKENTPFQGLQVELILLIGKMIELGLTLFDKEGLKNWVHSPAFSLNNRTPLETMQSYA
ncbi:MAG TPA: hypothetical protein PLU10_10025, partial [Chitinophagaceae bacterium]|nr:hypothetical protein [Chitinophagaceae bacterium]